MNFKNTIALTALVISGLLSLSSAHAAVITWNLDSPSGLLGNTQNYTAGGATIDEILLHQDNVARRLYYSVQDDCIPGVRNYMATVFVDEIAADRCRVSISGIYDASDKVVGSASKAFIELVYEAGIIGGMAQYLKRQAAPAGR